MLDRQAKAEHYSQVQARGGINEMVQEQMRAGEALVGSSVERQEADMKTYTSGAKRSKGMPPWYMLPRRALRAILERFIIGLKYGLHNWKKAMDGQVQRGPQDVTRPADLEFVRQFWAHMDQHLTNVLELVDQPPGALSEKGDDLVANLAAAGWNIICLLEYLLENEDLVREAISQYPKGHSKHRQDVLLTVAQTPVNVARLAGRALAGPDKPIAELIQEERARHEGRTVPPELAPSYAYERAGSQ